MTLDKETEWRLECLKVATDFSIACREIQTNNPGQTIAILIVIMTDLVTELWDQGFSQTEIRQAFKTALDGLPAYAAGQDRRD